MSERPLTILAGDIGGTKTVLALFESAPSGLHQVHEIVFKSSEYRSFDDLLEEFRHGDTPPLDLACFGVAGAVIDGRARITNLPWVLEESALATVTKAAHVKLLNDLEATAYGVLFLGENERSVLNAGARRTGNIAVVAAGTGLGEAILFSDGTHLHPIATEGGHGDFAPRSDEEIELLRHLRTRFGRVSYERVLSGPGIHNIYVFLRETGYAQESAALAKRLTIGDPSAVITECGLDGTEPLCVRTLDLFSSIYGAEAGNLALKCLAVGGVFITGGIAPKLLPVLQSGSFMRGFTDKGRFATLLERIPVAVALNPRAPLLGAAHFALRGRTGQRS